MIMHQENTQYVTLVKKNEWITLAELKKQKCN